MQRSKKEKILGNKKLMNKDILKKRKWKLSRNINDKINDNINKKINQKRNKKIYKTINMNMKKK